MAGNAAMARERCLRILKSVGSWGKNLNYLGERFHPSLVIVVNSPPRPHSRSLSVDNQQMLQRGPHRDRC